MYPVPDLTLACGIRNFLIDLICTLAVRVLGFTLFYLKKIVMLRRGLFQELRHYVRDKLRYTLK